MIYDMKTSLLQDVAAEAAAARMPTIVRTCRLGCAAGHPARLSLVQEDVHSGSAAVGAAAERDGRCHRCFGCRLLVRTRIRAQDRQPGEARATALGRLCYWSLHEYTQLTVGIARRPTVSA